MKLQKMHEMKSWLKINTPVLPLSPTLKKKHGYLPISGRIPAAVRE